MPPVLGLPDLELKSIDYAENIYINAVLEAKPACPDCNSSHIYIKDSFDRRINHTRLGNQLVIIRYRSHKYLCRTCGKYFNLKIQGLLGKRQSSESFRLDVFERHQGGVTQKYLSTTHKISHATVDRWYKEKIQDRISELKDRKVPAVLGIDEHFFTKKKGYATTMVDLKSHKVFDVVLGRFELEPTPI